MFNRKKTDFGNKILYCGNSERLLDDELSSISPQSIYMGMETDPYQPCEEKLLTTRNILKTLLRNGFSSSILTKSDLILRDIDIIEKMKEPSVGISVAFQLESIRKMFEENAPSNNRRINALKKFKERGIETYALICPVMPYITEVKTLIEKLVLFSDTIWVNNLSFDDRKDNNWKNIEAVLEQNYPELVDDYRSIAFDSNNVYWVKLESNLRKFAREKGYDLIVEFE